MSTDPLATALAALVEELEKPGALLGWAIQYARDGDLRPAWDTCEDPRVLLRVCALAGDMRGVVRAACVAARTVLAHVPDGEPRPRAAIEAAEAWARGEGDADVAQEAGTDAEFAGDELETLAATTAAWAASKAAWAAADPDNGFRFGESALEHAAGSAAYAAGYTDDTDDADADAVARYESAYEPELARLGAVVRAAVACPSLAVIIERRRAR